MALNERELQEVQQNKSIRGYIVRCLVKGSNNSAITKHISNALFVQGMIMSPDIGKYVDYLVRRLCGVRRQEDQGVYLVCR